MLPDTPVPARRKKAGLILAAMTSFGFGVRAVLTDPPPTLGTYGGLAFVFVANVAIVYYAWPDSDGFLLRIRGRRGRGSGARTRPGAGPGGLAARRPGRAGTRPAATPSARQPILRAVARLMPAAPGRRWLAEAESLLFELPAAQRRRAVRSYLWSAPRLIAAMWVRQLSSRPDRRA